MDIQRLAEKCNGCLLCVKDCVSGVWRNIDGIPEIKAPDSCNRCSHCLAVCPREAIIHPHLDHRSIRRSNVKLLDPEVYQEILITRRSIRNYSDRPVSKETLERIIDACRYSPTASNSQNVAYIIIQDKALIQTVSNHIFGFAKNIFHITQTSLGAAFMRAFEATSLVKTIKRYTDSMHYYTEQVRSGRDLIFHNAPVLILLHGPKGSSFASDNCNIAAANIMNYAHSIGLGTCMIGFLILALKHSKKIRKHFYLPKNRRVYAALVLGYPAFRHMFTVSRTSPNIKWIGF